MCHFSIHHNYTFGSILFLCLKMPQEEAMCEVLLKYYISDIYTFMEERNSELQPSSNPLSRDTFLSGGRRENWTIIEWKCCAGWRLRPQTGPCAVILAACWCRLFLFGEKRADGEIPECWIVWRKVWSVKCSLVSYWVIGRFRASHKYCCLVFLMSGWTLLPGWSGQY